MGFGGVDLRKRGSGHRCNFPDAVVQEVAGWIRGVQAGGDSGRCGNPLNMTEHQREVIRTNASVMD